MGYIWLLYYSYVCFGRNINEITESVISGSHFKSKGRLLRRISILTAALMSFKNRSAIISSCLNNATDYNSF